MQACCNIKHGNVITTVASDVRANLVPWNEKGEAHNGATEAGVVT